MICTPLDSVNFPATPSSAVPRPLVWYSVQRNERFVQIIASFPLLCKSLRHYVILALNTALFLVSSIIWNNYAVFFFS
jgi:hypothetical protein